MEPRYIDKEAFLVVGVPARGSPSSLPYDRLWGALDEHYPALEGHLLDPAGYGAYYPSGEEGVVEFIAGVAMREAPDPLPAGLVAREVPAAHYAAFSCTLREVGRSYGFIYGEWQPPAGYAFDHVSPGLEVFAGGGGPDAPVEILIPLRPPT